MQWPSVGQVRAENGTWRGFGRMPGSLIGLRQLLTLPGMHCTPRCLIARDTSWPGRGPHAGALLRQYLDHRAPRHRRDPGNGENGQGEQRHISGQDSDNAQRHS